jgi:hypothetical protein
VWALEFILLVGFLYFVQSSSTAIPTGATKSLLFFLQTSTAINMGIVPSGLIGIAANANFIKVARLSGLSCFWHALANPAYRFICFMLVPLALAIVLTFAIIVSHLTKGCYKRCHVFLSQKWGTSSHAHSFQTSLHGISINEEEAPLLIEEEVLEDVDVHQTDSSPLKHHKGQSIVGLKHRVLQSLLFLFYASHFELSNLVLELLEPCEESEGGTTWMTQYPWLRCDGSDAALLRTLACIFLALYVLGIPLVIALLLWSHKYWAACRACNHIQFEEEERRVRVLPLFFAADIPVAK